MEGIRDECPQNLGGSGVKGAGFFRLNSSDWFPGRVRVRGQGSGSGYRDRGQSTGQGSDYKGQSWGQSTR